MRRRRHKDKLQISTFSHPPILVNGPCTVCGKAATNLIEVEDRETGRREPDVLVCDECLMTVTERLVREGGATPMERAAALDAVDVWNQRDRRR